MHGGSVPNEYALLAWQARILERDPRDRGHPQATGFHSDDRWLSDLVALTRLKDGPKRAQGLLLSKGIVLTTEKHLSGTYLDGGAMIDCDGRPVIGLTLRHDRLDNFWFVLLHELGHVFLHLTDGLGYDFFDEEGDGRGRQGRARGRSVRARQPCPEAKWDLCLSRFALSEEAVGIDAKNLGIHPSIIAGRIRRGARRLHDPDDACWRGTGSRRSSRTVAMNLSEETYVPALRWRQGEYQALYRLTADREGASHTAYYDTTG